MVFTIDEQKGVAASLGISYSKKNNKKSSDIMKFRLGERILKFELGGCVLKVTERNSKDEPYYEIKWYNKRTNYIISKTRHKTIGSVYIFLENLSSSRNMIKSLFTNDERYSEEAIELSKEIRDAIYPIIEKYKNLGYKLKEINSICSSEIDVMIMENIL
jgi:hypothetical protein